MDFETTGEYLEPDGEFLVSIAKLDVEKQQVFGWAYIAKDAEGNVLLDKSGDFVDDGTLEDLESAVYDYMKESRVADDRHDWGDHGRMIESVMFTREKIAKMGLPEDTLPVGWWVGYEITDADTWAAVKSGERSMFSIGGSGTREKVDF